MTKTKKKIYSMFLESLYSDLNWKWKQNHDAGMYNEAGIVALLIIDLEKHLKENNFTIHREELYK